MLDWLAGLQQVGAAGDHQGHRRRVSGPGRGHDRAGADVRRQSSRRGQLEAVIPRSLRERDPPVGQHLAKSVQSLLAISDAALIFPGKRQSHLLEAGTGWEELVEESAPGTKAEIGRICQDPDEVEDDGTQFDPVQGRFQALGGFGFERWIPGCGGGTRAGPRVRCARRVGVWALGSPRPVWRNPGPHSQGGLPDAGAGGWTRCHGVLVLSRQHHPGGLTIARAGGGPRYRLDQLASDARDGRRFRSCPAVQPAAARSGRRRGPLRRCSSGCGQARGGRP